MAPVRTRVLAFAGLAALVPISLGLLRGSISVEAAALRAAVLLVIVVLIDRVVAPIVRDLIRPERSE